MKATDFVRGKKYVVSGGDVLEFSHSNSTSLWFLDNKSGEWEISENGLIGFRIITDSQFDSWKEYVEPIEAIKHHINGERVYAVDDVSDCEFKLIEDSIHKKYYMQYDSHGDYLPSNLTRDQLIVHKYAVGDKMAKVQGLTIDHFEPGIQAIKWSQNPNEKSKFLHCHGFNKLSGQFTFFVCKLKTDK